MAGGVSGIGRNMAWRKWDRAHNDWSGGSALGRVDEQAVQLPDPVGGEAAGAAGADAVARPVCCVARRWAALQHGALLRDPVMPVIPGQAMPHEHSANMRRIAPVGTRRDPLRPHRYPQYPSGPVAAPPAARALQRVGAVHCRCGPRQCGAAARAQRREELSVRNACTRSSGPVPYPCSSPAVPLCVQEVEWHVLRDLELGAGWDTAR
jgi:hypothetical protein